MKKVSLRELLASKIIYWIAVVVYYWMWARTDWKTSYPLIQNCVGGFLFAFIIIYNVRIRKYNKENFDELAQENLRRCDSICLKVLMIIMAVAAYTAGIFGHLDTFNSSIIGYAIVITLLGISILRAAMFAIMDNKGV